MTMQPDPLLFPAEGVKTVRIRNANVTVSDNRMGGEDIAAYLPVGVTASLVDNGRTLEIRGTSRPQMQIGMVSGPVSTGMGTVYLPRRHPGVDVDNDATGG